MTKLQNLNALLVSLASVTNRINRSLADGAKPEDVADLTEVEAEMINMATKVAVDLLPSTTQ